MIETEMMAVRVHARRDLDATADERIPTPSPARGEPLVKVHAG
jgi:NADPH:quinone reductase-like Zn-dependent oxidoreductase